MGEAVWVVFAKFNPNDWGFNDHVLGVFSSEKAADDFVAGRKALRDAARQHGSFLSEFEADFFDVEKHEVKN